jgi:hypothetical protein
MIGSISHGTLRPEDLFESFLACALRLADEKQADDPTFLERVKDIESYEYDGEELSEVICFLEDILNEMALPYTYFGAHVGDGSDFGFWPSMDEIDELTKYDDFPETLPADDDFVMVNCHGNVSVYTADGKLIWDCV